MDYDLYNYNRPVYYSGPVDNTNYILYFILIVIIAFIAYKLWERYHTTTPTPTPTNDTQQTTQLQSQQTSQMVQRSPRNISINVDQTDNTPPVNPYRAYDYRALYDPLVAPRRRDDYNLPVLPVPTRGFPAPFKKMGLLVDKRANNDSRYKILILMGRNTYPSSNVYDYYATEAQNSAIKFNIEKTRELQTDDIVRIHELNNREYTVVLDKMLGYSYDPYLY